MIDIDFGEPLIPTFSDTFVYYSGFCFDYQWTRSYDAVEEYGNSFSYVARIEYKDRQDDSVFKKGSFYSINVKDDGALDGSNNPSYDEAAADINGNGITDETIFIYKGALTVQQVISTNQDVQISVQSDKSNFATGKVETSKNSEYEYKLRVRTGSNIVTNLVIYDSIEEYTKNSQQELVKASKGKNYWQGEYILCRIKRIYC